VSKVDKNQTGLSSEFFVAAELFRRQWDVTISFGSTKKFDLLAFKNGYTIAIQVKGMYAKKAGNWNINKEKINPNDKMFIIFVNLHSDQIDTSPEYFILTPLEALEYIVDENKLGNPVKQNYLPYSRLKAFKNNWERLENVCLIA
jgi:hypothetical protein